MSQQHVSPCPNCGGRGAVTRIYDDYGYADPKDVQCGVCRGEPRARSSMKKFPELVHLAYEPNADGEEDYLCVFTDGVHSLEPGQRVAIYKRIDEGEVRGPKSFVSKKRTR